MPGLERQLRRLPVHPPSDALDRRIAALRDEATRDHRGQRVVSSRTAAGVAAAAAVLGFVLGLAGSLLTPGATETHSTARPAPPPIHLGIGLSSTTGGSPFDFTHRPDPLLAYTTRDAEPTGDKP